MHTQLLTTAEVAKHIGVSAATVTNWRRLQKGPAYVRQGGVIRYPTDALAAWLSTNEVPTDA